MDEKKKKREEQIVVDGKAFPEKPGMFDYVKESFQPTATRADIEAMRRRRAKLTGTSG